MRVLLDECVDRRLGRELRGHFVSTVPRMGWAGIKNGELLELAQQDFDVLLTVDRKLSEEQRLTRFSIAVLLVRSRSNRLQDIHPLLPNILAAVEQATAGTLTVVGQ